MRILGNNLSNKKKIYIALTCIYGIGIPTSKKLLTKLNIDWNSKLADLTERNLSDLRDSVESEDLKLEGDLRRFNGLNIKRLNEINCHRGKRHRNSLPVRGQRTRTNARARRGSKKTVTNKKK